MLLEIKRLLLNEILCDRDFIPRNVTIEDYIAKLHKFACITEVCKSDNVVGFCAFYANDKVNKIGFISMVVVDPAYRGKGVADVVIESALKLMKLEGMHSCKLEVRQENIPALKLYRRLGFNVVPDENKSKDRIYMLKVF